MENSCRLNGLFQQSLIENYDLPAFSDYNGEGFTYGQIAENIYRFHRFFQLSGIEHGDKIALLGRNSSNWGVIFLAVMSYGSVVVPILPDFNSVDIHNIINHSGSKFLFVADNFVEKFNNKSLPSIEGFVNLTTMTVIEGTNPGIKENWSKAFDNSPFDVESFVFNELAPDHTCVISYTSGTSGLSKGVMIPALSLYSNLIFAREHMPIKANDTIVSFLPMAHVFGLLFDFLFPVTVGCHITFLSKAPTPQIIIKAFKEIKPRLILSVPLVIEKIYKKQILPKMQTPLMSVLLKIPGISSLIYKKIKNALIETFGGQFYEIVIGGAALNAEVEKFFRKIDFKFTVGYGMTECGPLVSYASWNTTQPLSAGKLVDRMEVRIDSPDPFNIVGEILVKGDNNMLGYYKNEEATRETIDEDGWLHTGDLGITDENQFIYIKGRCKNMLLGANGQNIYPEEIEVKLSNAPFVAECVVVERDGKLIGLVFPDADAVKEQEITSSMLEEQMEENRQLINRDLPRYSQISRIEIVCEEFEKTPKRNIKRYRYT